MISKPTEVCLDAQRRNDVRARGRYGIDYAEVSEDQLVLAVYFLGQAPKMIVKENVQITGGVRVRPIRVLDLRWSAGEDPDQDNCLLITVDKAGDYSVYTLRFVEVDDLGQPTDKPLASFDPLYAQLEFSFKAGLSSDLDCKPRAVCAPESLSEPDINYLAKDYESFRQLILDRLALLIPDWQEQHVPDVGIALVEILAYTGDYLSYYQDAVATEAYLDTARQRISVKRHVRLIDYFMHEGCNARSWVVIETNMDVASPPLDPQSIYFLAGLQDPQSVPSPGELTGVPGTQYEVFAPLTTAPVPLYKAHNQIEFYTWGNQLCCLAAGSVSATLRDEWEAPIATVPAAPQVAARGKKGPEAMALKAEPKENPPVPPPVPPLPPVRKLHLKPGDILFFEEIGANADRNHRHFVRLTKVEPWVDPLYNQPVVEIQWAAEDALPLALCLSQLGPPPDCAFLKDSTVARGNVVLVDHGVSIASEALGTVPLAATTQRCRGIARPRDLEIAGGAFEPVLKNAPLTFHQPLAAESPAAGALLQDPRRCLPQIQVMSIPPQPDGSGPLFSFADLENPSPLAAKLARPVDRSARYLCAQLSSKTKALLSAHEPPAPVEGEVSAALGAELKELVRYWTPQRDLLSSQAQDFHFVVEIDDQGLAHLRFGDGVGGRAPEAGEAFAANYRIGNGPTANVGALAITQMVSATALGALTVTPRNPIAASGGTVSESIDEVKLFAPGAFQSRLERAITADDYATLAEQNVRVQRAAAELQWTGTRYEAHVAIDPLGTDQVDPNLLAEIRGYLHRFRRIGHDVVVVPAQYVSLDVAMTVNVTPNYIRAHVESALLDVFSNRVLNGGKGFFHPDNLSFGQSIHVSNLVAAAQRVKGVLSVTVTKLERLFAGPNHELEEGILPIGGLEVGRLDNDPSFPENGKFTLTLRGGR
jgi:hypothetical protein